MSESPKVLLQVRHNFPSPFWFYNIILCAYWGPQGTGLETRLRTYVLGMTHDDQGKKPGEEKHCKS